MEYQKWFGVAVMNVAGDTLVVVDVKCPKCRNNIGAQWRGRVSRGCENKVLLKFERAYCPCCDEEVRIRLPIYSFRSWKIEAKKDVTECIELDKHKGCRKGGSQAKRKKKNAGIDPQQKYGQILKDEKGSLGNII